jgi:DNA repair protein RadD
VKLRWYQEEALAATWSALRERDDNPCVVLPTGAGKSPLMAAMCRDAVQVWGGRVVILAHVKELLQQTADKLATICHEVGVGVYSAGLGRKETIFPVTVAGIQSAYRNACDFGSVDLVLVDEAHLIPPDGEGMYRTFLETAKIVNPAVRVIGLTATPYRMTTGNICEPENILNHVCYEVGVAELIAQGFLCRLVSRVAVAEADLSGVHVRSGEFIPGELEAAMDGPELLAATAREIAEKTADRRSVLVFCCGVQHATDIAALLPGCEVVTGDTPSEERADILGRFRAGSLRYLANVNVLTTGFDAPNIDCIVMLRPTLSPGLYYQMAGRGFRLCEGKASCLVLDFAGNCMRHGPVDTLVGIDKKKRDGKGESPSRMCPECRAAIHAAYRICPECGAELPVEDKAKHTHKAGEAPILSGEITDARHDVHETNCCVHRRKGWQDGYPLTLRMQYRIGWHQWQSEWICIEHTGYARQKAEEWWALRSNVPCPKNAHDAADLVLDGALADTKAITVRMVAGEKYGKIVGYELGEKPEYREAGWDDEAPARAEKSFDYGEVPF